MQYASLHAFFYKQHFKAKNQANAKQHPEAEFLTSEKYWHSSSRLSSDNKTYSQKQAKEQACLYSWDYAINHNENEDEN